MKKTFYLLLFVLFVSASLSKADDGIGLNRKDKPFIKELRDAERTKKGGLININCDIQLGLGISKTSFDLSTVDTSTQNLNSTSTKIGPTVGAILSVDLFGFGFTTGFQYSSKGFKTSSGNSFGANYFNLPLLFYFDTQIDKIIIDGNIGPYFGLLLSSEPSTVYKIKNFDFGLTGNVQGAYMFQKHLGVLLGVKYEYGGLNNLGNNDKVNKITSSTFYIYSGVKFIL